jgi:hypothetical protein
MGDAARREDGLERLITAFGFAPEPDLTDAVYYFEHSWPEIVGALHWAVRDGVEGWPQLCALAGALVWRGAGRCASGTRASRPR